MSSNQPPPIIKRVKKGHHDAHHGGAWKIAYADFVTAMMAFFLLLWLLNVATEDQKKGIANYFAPINVSKSKSGSGGVLGGRNLNEPGPMRTSTSSVTVAVPLPPVPPTEQVNDAEDMRSVDEETIEEMIREREEEQFAEAELALRQAIQEVPEMRQLADNLLIDKTPEGLRIQLVDQERLAMFPLGSDAMFEHTRTLLALVAEVVDRMSNKIAVTGHTDATPYATQSGYSNWELSTDRANSSRRALVDHGLPANRIARVAGLADREPLIADDPSDPRNRRISIVLLREAEGAKVEPAP